MSKCPKCEKTFTQVAIKPITGKGNVNIPCISMNCPNCDTSLSVTFDPIEYLAAIAKAVKR